MREQSTKTLAIETDTALAALYRRGQSEAMYLDIAESSLAFYAKKTAPLGYYEAEQVKRLEAEAAKRITAIAAIKAEAAPLDAIYEAHRWRRAFLVVSSAGGHVHFSMNCSTCNPRTGFHWLPQYSGESEEKIVADAGERACTVCYPSAPVGVKGTAIFSDDELAAQKRAEEKAAAKIARDAKKAAAAPTKSGAPLTIIEAHTGWDGTVRTYKRTLNTEITAKSEYVSMAQEITWSKWPQDIEAKKVAMALIAEALAEKHGVSIEEETAALAKRIADKKRREG